MAEWEEWGGVEREPLQFGRRREGIVGEGTCDWRKPRRAGPLAREREGRGITRATRETLRGNDEIHS